MTLAGSHAPSAVHIGADDLPFVDLGGGNILKVIQRVRASPARMRWPADR